MFAINDGYNMVSYSNICIFILNKKQKLFKTILKITIECIDYLRLNRGKQKSIDNEELLTIVYN